MKTPIFKKSMVLILVLLFASTKVIGIHGLLHDHHDHHDEHSHENHFGLHVDSDCDDYSHDDSPQDNEDHEENCQLCDLILLDSFAQYFGADQDSETTELIHHFDIGINAEYTSVDHSLNLSADLFSRPPPTV